MAGEWIAEGREKKWLEIEGLGSWELRSLLFLAERETGVLKSWSLRWRLTCPSSRRRSGRARAPVQHATVVCLPVRGPGGSREHGQLLYCPCEIKALVALEVGTQSWGYGCCKVLILKYIKNIVICT